MGFSNNIRQKKTKILNFLEKHIQVREEIISNDVR